MFAYLEGIVQFKEGNQLVINVNGVGYLVFASGSLTKVATKDESLSMFIQTEVREQSISLFGFTDLSEKHTFKLLCSVPGVGPKTAMLIMEFSVAELQEAILDENIKKLCTIPGLGKKTAQRLILELKKKLPESISMERSHSRIHPDIYDALRNLGYKTQTIDEVLKNIPAEIKNNEEVIRFFLKSV